MKTSTFLQTLPARCGVTLLVGILTLVLLHDPGWTAADATQPLEPLDTSSPRATLTHFLHTIDALGHFLRDTYRTTPSPANW